MEKAKYRVYINYKVSYTYVTTTRNTEDMISQIRKMHEHSIHDYYYYFKITRETNGEEKEVYVNKGKNNESWESELYK